VKSLVGESEQSPRRQEALFAAMVRNASRVTGCFRLPSEEVVEIGRQISIKKMLFSIAAQKCVLRLIATIQRGSIEHRFIGIRTSRVDWISAIA
jgi:hypothetical protein